MSRPNLSLLCLSGILLGACGASSRGLVIERVEAGDLQGALAAYDRHRAVEGDDLHTLARVAQAQLIHAALGPNARDQELAVRALRRSGRAAREALDRIAIEGDGVTRALALEGLQSYGFQCAGETLRALVRDEDARVRAVALGALQGAEDDALRWEATSDPAASVRRAAVRGLGGPSLSVAERTQLIRMARMDTSPPVRAEAILALRRVGEETFDLIRDRLDDPDHSVRRAAVRALIDLDVERGWLALQNLFHGPPSLVSLEAIARRASHQIPIAGMSMRAAMDHWMEALRSPEPLLRTAAVSGLRALEVSERMERVLRERVEVEPLASVRLALLLELLRHEGSHRFAREGLGAMMRESDGMPGLQAAAELARLDEAEAIRYIWRATEDQDPVLRAVAFECLARDLGRFDVALAGLRDEVSRVRLRTAGSIMRLAAHER